MTDRDCHTGPDCLSALPAELRALVTVALDRIEPIIDRMRSEPATAATATCAVCPVCAVIAALRGERPELAVRLAEQAAGVLAVLRVALDEGNPGPVPPEPERAPPTRTVQYIHVERVRARR